MGIVDKATKGAATVATVAALVKVTINEEHGEVDRFAVVGIPLFKRDKDGNPRLFGIPFKRRRGPRDAK